MIRMMFLAIVPHEQGPSVSALRDALNGVYDGEKLPWVEDSDRLGVSTCFPNASDSAAIIFASRPLSAEQVELGWDKFVEADYRGIVEIEE